MFNKCITNQYKELNKSLHSLQSLKSNLAKARQLDLIGHKHSELLKNLEIFSSIYMIPLLMNEFLCIVCSLAPLVMFIYNTNEIVSAAAAATVPCFNSIYPILGENVSSAAVDFALVASDINWIYLSNRNRKKLSMIIMMAQKPVGISSGKFHYSNHLEITQVRVNSLEVQG